MLISPPFLPTASNNVQDTNQYIDHAMQGGVVGSGGFPISMAMCWHGGLHLDAPSAAEPVRAIADGVVVYAGNHGSCIYDNKKYSTGCVVIRHTTEIGANGDQPVSVTFYSISQHIIDLYSNIQSGAKVYRKDPIGKAGLIYNKESRIHFEIIAGDADVACMMPKLEVQNRKLPLDRDGRSDAIYGQIYFYVPKNTPTYQTISITSAQATQTSHTSADFIIGIQYGTGQGGDASVTTYHTSRTL